MLDTVQDLVGHCARFDYQEMSGRLPNVDLPALRPFFTAMLSLNNRRVQETERGLTFKTPDVWLTVPAVRSTYSDMVFSRRAEESPDSEKVLGFGHAVFHEAIGQARGLSECVTALPKAVLSAPLLVFKVSERVTSTKATLRSVVVAATFSKEGKVAVVPDCELVERLNEMLNLRTFRRDPAPRSGAPTDIERKLVEVEAAIKENLESLDVPFLVPDVQLIAILCQSATDAPHEGVTMTEP
jgi:hypothetical protein